MTEREAVARIIDGEAWEKLTGGPRYRAWCRQKALAKADAILARQEGVVEALRFVRDWDALHDALPDYVAGRIATALHAYDQANGDK